ncbi:transporter [Sulfurifustis variabilis]|uniref:Transporter n=1 Tax=Sulfurifustis variabilis TaxID=1675686 RepID=A0A1B4V1X8_9GAMM|nr:cation diffusion facilitator family transporter [Sulfurifustis variabilis]BAU47509.1 transporter [Sulfurifustis variabilis]
MTRDSLTRFAWLSIAAAIATIVLKGIAWWLTGSVGLLSDALESFVNLGAGLLALWMLTIAARPADAEHPFGHGKAEYFSSGAEGTMILAAAASIATAALPRLFEPRPLERIGVGLAVSAVAAAVNLSVAQVLRHAGRRHRSITLQADGDHLMTDVWTSVGVIAAVTAVAYTGWLRLDPLIALVVAGYIAWTGLGLIRRSVRGLMDYALPAEETARVTAILDRYGPQGVAYHALRTREAGHRRFITFHLLVPGAWSVERGHALLEEIEAEIREALPHANVLGHLEPVEHTSSYEDMELDR